MSEWVAIIILAIVQGATEFLPVSSSGHLSLGHALLGASEDPPLLVDIVLHVGTLVAVVGVYRRDVAKLVTRTLQALVTRRFDDPYARLGLMVVGATLATTIVALTLKDVVEGTLRGPTIVGSMLLLNGAILWSARRVQRPEAEASVDDGTPETPDRGLSWRSAGLIGILQGLAVTPGISRSGLTITGALHLGVSGPVAARFSFLLSIPAILGALVLKLVEIDAIGEVHWLRLGVGALVAAAVGWVCLVLLLKLLNRARFHHFAWYCWGLGIVAIVASL